MSTMPTAPSQQPPLAPVGAAGHAEDEIDLSRESVAGEEDPGASLDLGTSPSSQPPEALKALTPNA